MKRFFSKIIIFLITLCFGVAITTSIIFFQKPVKRKLALSNVSLNIQIVKPVFSPISNINNEDLSPYDIERLIKSHPKIEIEELWENLKIPKIFHGTSFWNKTDNFFTSCNNCTAETFKLELDGQPNPEVLLKIEDRFYDNCRFLIFKQITSKTNNKWQLLGYIDHDFGRYEMPKHFTFLSGGKNWLVVQTQVGSGSGFALYNYRLFTIRNNKVVEILEFPAEGHTFNLGLPDWSSSAHIIDCKIEKNTVIVEIEFATTYSTFNETNENDVLWVKKQKAIFRKNLNSGKVILDRKKSNLSQRELKSVYGFDSLTNEAIVKYNFEELKKISLRKDAAHKKWLQDFLQLCEPIREKKILQRNLSK